MPAAIAGYFFVAGTIGYAIVYAAVTIVIEFGLSKLSQSLQGKPRQPSGDINQSPASRDINVRGTTEFGQIIYGEALVSGCIVFIGVSTVSTQILYYVVVVADHQVESITDCVLDDRIVPNTDIVSGLVTTPAFINSGGQNCLKIYKHLGAHNQTANADLVAQFTEWDSNHRGAGVAYVVYELSQDPKNEIWAAGAPQNLRALVKGKRVYDPRLDSTNGGSGSQRVNDATTWAWSNNPALCARDYITGGSYWFSQATPKNNLGVGESNSRINDAYVIAAANICEQQVNIPLGFAITPNLTISGTGLTRTIAKTSGAGWNARAYFSQGMTSIDIVITLANITTDVMVGIDGHPQDSLSYTSIDFAWTYSTIDGALAIYENGVKISNYGSYIVGTTTLEIIYSSGTVTYKKNGAVQRTTSASGPLYITSSLLQVPGSFTITLSACTQNRYTCDTQLSCGDTHLTNMTTLLSAMSGHVSYVNGKYRLYAGAYDTPSITIVPDDVLGDMELITHPNGEDVYNYVTGTFYDEDRNWALSTFPAQTQSTYQTDDGGLFIRSIDLRATRQNYRAQRMANVVLNQSRNKININFSALSPKAINISEWETFYVTLPEYGYNAQVFRCLEWKFLPTGLIGITARIENASSYNDPAISDYTDPASNQPPYSQLEPPLVPSNLTLTGFPTYINALVTLPGSLRKGEIVEIWENTSSTPFSGATKIDEGSKQVFQIPKRDTTTRYYWVRIRYNGQYSVTYPASTGAGAAADLNQTTDTAANAITNSYSNSATYSGGVSPTSTLTFDSSSITFTPAVNGTASVVAFVDGNASLDADSGSSVGLCIDPTSDVSSGVPGGSAVFGQGTSMVSTTRITAALASDFSVTAGTNYTVGMVMRKTFGTFKIYATSVSVTLKKR